jgi:hypothetical protein
MPAQRLPIDDLAERHPGVTPAIASAYTEAARVCLDRHHRSPATFKVTSDGLQSDASIDWTSTSDQERGAWANDIDATEAGAYAVALAAIELSAGMVAVRRAETCTGADYYVAPPGRAHEDLEDCFRLEISGTDKGDESDIGVRLRAKEQQAREGESNLPALAAVVGFKALCISTATVSSP